MARSSKVQSIFRVFAYCVADANKVLVKRIIEAIKGASESCSELFASIGFVPKVFPVLNKLMKQHVLHNSDFGMPTIK